MPQHHQLSVVGLPVDDTGITTVPSRRQVREDFYAQCDVRAKAIYLSIHGNHRPTERRDSYGLWRKIWDNASEGNGMRITAQVLRKWFGTEMGELGVPDRYVDIFQGRAPRSVLGKHYTGKGLERLKRIYDKAGLHVLS